MPNSFAPVDPVALTQSLIRCASVTPSDDGALDVVAGVLESLGFIVHRLDFDGTPNLYARRGIDGPHLCFAGHTDVVPPGSNDWSSDPFDATLRDGTIIGRGASDMKGAIAAFLAAVSQTQPEVLDLGSVSLLITGDEEGPATGGTVRVLEWLADRGDMPDFTLVGEATNPERIGDVIKIGRRGSLNANLTVRGFQGHVAYPHLVDNPVHRLIRVLNRLATTPLDEGSECFEPSSLQITTIDVGNAANNMVPAEATAHLNIRFNDLHSAESLEGLIRRAAEEFATDFTLLVEVSGDPFITAGSSHVALLSEAVTSVTGRTPSLDTGGGTSDARFIAHYGEVAEFGLISSTIHQIDEHVVVSDLQQLTVIYRTFLAKFLTR
ncbi:succinyl-diaminopimelate desuccinylase [Rathayibacter sp. AY1D1]|nr:succinyl-diaminopimelate desuccinylase [Rathayibacter sp. AY1D1]